MPVFSAAPKKPTERVHSHFGETQNVQEVWDLTEKDAYVDQQGRRRLPRFLVPAIVFFVLAVLLFWFLPGLAMQYASSAKNAPQQVLAPDRIFPDTTRVVCVAAANIWSLDDIKSPRITQVLYNEPVYLIDAISAEGFIHIRTQDGIEGYMKSTDVTDNLDSVEPNLHKLKLIVSDISKNVKSDASNGTLLIEVMMNTVLYADVKSAGVYEVSLPGGGYGWVGSSGVIELGVRDPVEKVGVRYFVSSVQSFVDMTHLDHGLTKNGLSVDGLAYVSASVNGVKLPRTMEEQMAAGDRVDLSYDAVTGILNVESISPGDLVFFSDPNEPTSAAPYEMGICTDTGMLIMTSKSRTTLRLFTLADNASLESRIIAVRRIFT